MLGTIVRAPSSHGRHKEDAYLVDLGWRRERILLRQNVYDDTVADLILKLIWKSKCTRRAKKLLKKSNRGDLYFP